MDDQELLREYVERQSEKAFADLVARYINLVYSTALRVVQDTALAKDVAQSVFIQLACKARTIRSGHALPGWLYRVTRCQAANAVRDERIRQERETEAMTMKSPEHDASATWKSILPHLDDAMGTLKATEQNAIVLRFFEGCSWREVGTALSVNEDTAQKRVSRAVDKLRMYFQRRGVVLTGVMLGSAITANAVHAAPIGLAPAMASASLVKAAHAGFLSVLFTHFQALFMKKITYAVISASLIATITIPILVAKAGESPSAVPVTEASLQQGLILHYTFDHAPVAGQVIDASSAGNNGQAVGVEWTSDPQRGGVLQFSPPNQYIRVPDSDSLHATNLTLAAWIKTSDQGDTWRRVFDKSWTNGFALSIAGGHTPPYNVQGDAIIEIERTHHARSDQPVTDGQWHHLAATCNGAEIIFYVDGMRQRGSGHWKGKMPVNSCDLTIGINLVDPNPQLNEVGASFDGLMDDVMVFNRALSPDEIKFLFDSQKK
jgi:RNA polymerase sigma factor (sigma-70 family)